MKVGQLHDILANINRDVEVYVEIRQYVHGIETVRHQFDPEAAPDDETTPTGVFIIKPEPKP